MNKRRSRAVRCRVDCPRAVALVVCVLLLAACGADPAETPGESAEIDPVESALRAESRPAVDRERDAARKPAGVVRFFGVMPGMTVLDLFSGGGYYTEIVARVVGPRGLVLAHNNDAYLRYAADEIATRYGDGRLANVQRLNVPVTELSIAPESVDVALLILAYHDLYFRPPDGSWPEIDGPAMLALVYEALRPGGVLGVVDHVGNPDITLEEIDRLHRIDEVRVIREIEAAGFELEDRSDLLGNPADDHLRPMYEPSIRGRTDRMLLRFRKPTDMTPAPPVTADQATDP